MGTTKSMEKRRSRDPGEIWITSLAITVEKKVLILVAITVQLRLGSNRMQRHSVR